MDGGNRCHTRPDSRALSLIVLEDDTFLVDVRFQKSAA